MKPLLLLLCVLTLGCSDPVDTTITDVLSAIGPWHATSSTHNYTFEMSQSENGGPPTVFVRLKVLEGYIFEMAPIQVPGFFAITLDELWVNIEGANADKSLKLSRFDKNGVPIEVEFQFPNGTRHYWIRNFVKLPPSFVPGS